MRDPLRILMLNIEYPPLGGGASPVTRGLARALVARGHEVDLLTMGYRGLSAEEDDRGVRVLRVSRLWARVERSRVPELAAYAVAALRRARALAAERRYDLCHAHFVLPTGLVPYALRRAPAFPPYVLTAHGSDVPGYNPDRFTLLHRLTPPLIRRVLRASAGIVVPSAALEGLLRSRFAGALPALRRIPNGVDVERFVRRPKEARVLVATRLFERKGVQHAIEALAAIPGHGHALEIAGDGPARAALERQAREAGLPCRFHGWLARDRLDELYERSRIFVLASASDNFPVSLLEAMAARCAIVTTRAGGIPEVVGDAALLVDPGDTRALGDALGALFRDPALVERLGERAWRRVSARFGWPAIVTEHEALYRSAAAARALPAGPGPAAALA